MGTYTRYCADLCCFKMEGYSQRHLRTFAYARYTQTLYHAHRTHTCHTHKYTLTHLAKNALGFSNATAVAIERCLFAAVEVNLVRIIARVIRSQRLRQVDVISWSDDTQASMNDWHA